MGMVRLLSLLIIIGISFADTKTVAISYFDNTSGLEQYNPLSKGLADMLITDLSNVKSIQIVEREKLESLLKEIDLGESKFMDPSTAQKLGNGLGAQYILTGAFLSIDPMMRIDARLVEVGSGKVIGADEVTGHSNNFFELEKKLAESLIKRLNIKESIKNPVKKDIDIDAILNYSEAIDLDDKGFKEEATNLLQETIDDFPEFILAQEKLDAIKKLINKLANDREIKMEKLIKETLSSLDPNSESSTAEIHNLWNTYLMEQNYSQIYKLNRYLDSYGDEFLSKDINNNSLRSYRDYYDVLYFSTMKNNTKYIEAATNFLLNYPTNMYFPGVKLGLESAINIEEKNQKNRKLVEKYIPIINYYRDIEIFGGIIRNMYNMNIYAWAKMALHERIIPMYEKIEYGHSKWKEDIFSEDWKLYNHPPYGKRYNNFYDMLNLYFIGALIYDDDEEIRWIHKYIEEHSDIAFDKDDFDTLDDIEDMKKKIVKYEKQFDDLSNKIAAVPTYSEIDSSLKMYTSIDEIYEIQKIWKSINLKLSNRYNSLPEKRVYIINVQSCGIFIDNLNQLKGIDEDSTDQRKKGEYIELYDQIFRAKMLSTIQNGDYDNYRVHLKEYKSNPVIKSMKNFRSTYAKVKKTNDAIIAENEVIKNLLNNRDYLLLKDKSEYYRDIELYEEEAIALLKIMKYKNIKIAERDQYYYFLMTVFYNLGKFDKARNVYQQWDSEISSNGYSSPTIGGMQAMLNIYPK